jgi:hypothetical protein
MDTTFFFKVWDIYQAYWGREEQRQLKKRHSARRLETLLRNSHRMKGLYYMRRILGMMWGDDDDTHVFEQQEELLHAIKSMGKACMGEEDLYDSLMDPYTRMMNNVHVFHHFCYLSVEQRQWMSLRRPKCAYGNDTKDCIYSLSALLVLSSL